MTEAPAKQAMKDTQTHLDKFARFQNEASQPSWVFPVRKAGITRFAEMGFPTLHDEDWRFTNVSPIARLPFKPVFNLEPDGVSADRLKQFAFGRLEAIRLVFLNGHYLSELSATGAAAQGVVVKNLA